MAKYVQINSVPNGSTGGVMQQVQAERAAAGDECWMMWGRGRAAENDHEFNFGSKIGLYIDVLQTRIDGKAGFHSKAATKRLLAKLEEIKPDVVHLHNIHGYYVNIEMLFEWLAAHDCHVNWTLHDCWAFTGHCAHFTYVKCAQWKIRCAHDEPCCQLDAYPKTISKASVPWSFEQKKQLFTVLPPDRMTLITPSKWLADLVSESFLAEYPVEVRHNTVDTSVFRSTPSDLRQRYALEDKYIILGVASPWTERKGLNDFIQLAHEIDDSFTIVLVGLSKKQIKQMPKNIIALERTDSAEELAGIYTTADVFFNPTKEDNFPTVNLEAEACGLPCIVYNTGGCKETTSLSSSRCVNSHREAFELFTGFKQKEQNA